MVKRKKPDNDGKTIDIEHRNSLTDMRAYEVEFIDGTTETLTANIITENLITQVDEEGHRKLLLEDIINYVRNSDAVHRDDTFFDTITGMRQRKVTTKGWEICVRWKDVSTDWIVQNDLKQYYPTKLANFSQPHGTHEVPYFEWWDTYSERKGKTILSKLKSKYWWRMHKYRIKIPKSVMEV